MSRGITCIAALVLCACSADASRDDPESSERESELGIASAPPIPRAVSAKSLGGVTKVPYGRLSRHRLYGGKLTTFEVATTPGDDVALHFRTRLRRTAPILLVIGDPDPADVARCEARNARCQDDVLYPIIDSVQLDQEPSAKLVLRASGPSIKYAIAGRSDFVEVMPESIETAAKPETCVAGVLPQPGRYGPLDIIVRTRECQGGTVCGKWREASRQYLGALDVSEQSPRLSLVHDAGTTLLRGGRLAGADLYSHTCSGRTTCIVRAGYVDCEPLVTASVAPGATILDGDRCSTSSKPNARRFRGTASASCVGLSGGLVRETEGDLVREFEQVIVRTTL